jgi:hypothetical protein
MRCCLFNGSWLFNGCGKWLFDLVSICTNLMVILHHLLHG